MGKRKGGFNWKARQQNETIVDRSVEKKVWIVLKADSIYTDVDIMKTCEKNRVSVWVLSLKVLRVQDKQSWSRRLLIYLDPISSASGKLGI